MKLLLATKNPGKLRELRALVGDLFQIASLDDHPGPEVDETGETFEENARLKALAHSARTGLPTLADDSGLCVDALGGAPGVRSARYAAGTDADRIEKLLSELRAVPDERRGAEFRCALCLALPSGETIVEVGECRGRIIAEPRGRNGFGYDPIFFIPELGRTMAELAPEEKGRISHRARALAKVMPHLRRLAEQHRSPR